MIDTIVTALLLGFFAGAVPGPYTTVVASTALERGFRPALPLAFIPLVTEIPPLILTAIFLKNVNYDVLTAVGMVGGVAIGFIGLQLFRRQRTEFEGDMTKEHRRTFQAMAVGGLMSPAPWIFWLVAAGPLFLRSWNQTTLRGIVFVVILLSMLISTATSIAWLASHGHRVLTDTLRKRILRGVGVVLIAAGVALIWLAYEGNFQLMVQQQEALRERVSSVGS